jgi:pyrroloquinoline quinone biosynthesis protein E
MTEAASTHYRPYGLLAELTYNCPLHCPYCSNPTRYPTGRELATETWQRVIREAADLGVLHIGFSGGEPLHRPDLCQLVATARNSGLYTNLITSGVALSLQRCQDLKAAGLDNIQISFQADEATLADAIAGTQAHALKLKSIDYIHQSALPLSLNVVLHRGNIDRLENIIAFAESLGTERLELANTQYYGWAFKNRSLLLPSRPQIESANLVAAAAQNRLQGRMEVIYVMPDYFSDKPKPCMNGWGQRHITVNPIGDVLPCPTAGVIPGLVFDNVAQHALDWIWKQSSAFNRFRGTAWMPEPCRSCDLREKDFGGCRCQAALLTNNPNATDPACSLSPDHGLMNSLIRDDEAFNAAALEYRPNPPRQVSASI